MHEAVSDILLERSRSDDRVNRMVLLSLLAHTVAIAAVLAMPASWRSSSRNADVTPMMISISGGPAPDAGGQTVISNKPVQEVATETKPAPVVPPAPKVPEMVAPEPRATPLKNPPKRTERAVDKS